MTVMRAQATETPTSPREKCPEAKISPALETIILRALQKKPDQRYGSVAEFADEIEALQLAMSGAIQALSRPTPMQDGPPTKPMTEPEPPAPKAKPKKKAAPEIILSDPEPVTEALGTDEPMSFGGFSLEPAAPSFDLGDDTPSFVMGEVGEPGAGPDPDFDPFQDFDADLPLGRSTLSGGQGQKTPMIIAGAVLLVLLLGGLSLWAFSSDENNTDEKPAPSAEAPKDNAGEKPEEKSTKDNIPSGFGSAPTNDAPPMVRTNPMGATKKAAPIKKTPKKTTPKKTVKKAPKKTVKKAPPKKTAPKKAPPKKTPPKKGPPKSLGGPPKNL